MPLDVVTGLRTTDKKLLYYNIFKQCFFETIDKKALHDGILWFLFSRPILTVTESLTAMYRQSLMIFCVLAVTNSHFTH